MVNHGLVMVRICFIMVRYWLIMVSNLADDSSCADPDCTSGSLQSTINNDWGGFFNPMVMSSTKGTAQASQDMIINRHVWRYTWPWHAMATPIYDRPVIRWSCEAKFSHVRGWLSYTTNLIEKV